MYWDDFTHGTYEIKPTEKAVFITFTEKSESFGWLVNQGPRTKLTHPQS